MQKTATKDEMIEKIQVENEVEDSVFNVLRKQGVLCPSQITVHAGYSIKQIKKALTALLNEKLIEERPDLGEAQEGSVHEMAYGISRGKFSFLSPSNLFPPKQSS